MSELHQRLVVDLGSPEWRTRLMTGWQQLRSVVDRLVPNTVWWMWGDLCTANDEPRFGDASSVNALAFLPVPGHDPELSADLGAALTVLSSAVGGFHTDAGWVYEVPESHPAYLATKDAVEVKWRPRACTWISGQEAAHVGFVEVLP